MTLEMAMAMTAKAITLVMDSNNGQRSQLLKM